VVRSETRPVLALFCCSNLLGADRGPRIALEEKYSGLLRLFPIPCSGRLDALHLLKALEEFADGAYVLTCPMGECRHSEGNRWAEKRTGYARGLIESVGLEGERVGCLQKDPEKNEDLDTIIAGLIRKLSALGPSPVHCLRHL
jgi:coenzyme F420-reducing hydrogenase delta subunit